MAQHEVKVTEDTLTKLSKEKGVVFLLGWVDGKTVICAGCARDLQDWNEIVDFKKAVHQVVAFFPTGFRIVGLYCPCSETLAKEQSEEMFHRLLQSDVEDYVVGPLLAFVFFSGEEEESSCQNVRSFVYDMWTERSALARSLIVDSLSSNTVSLRIKGQMPLSFEKPKNTNNLEANIEKAINLLKDQVSSSACVYHVHNSSLIIHNSERNLSSHLHLNTNSTCADLVAYIQDETSHDSELLKKSKQKQSPLHQERIINLRLLIQTTGEEAIKNTISCGPIIRYERRDFTNIRIVLGIDVLVVVPPLMPLLELPALFTNGVCTQLSAIQQVLCRFYREKEELFLPRVYHFQPCFLGHRLSIVYPEMVSELELESYRQELHTRLLLPLERPVLRKCMQCSFSGELCSSGYLFNVHIGLAASGVEGGEIALVHGTYSYHHYMQDRCDDNGWGCAYRSLQTLISWFIYQGYTDKPIPTHVDIQKALVDIGDKPPSFINSKKWIGSMEVSYCLDHLIGIGSKIISVNSGAELSNKARELINHFRLQGTPIMIGGGVLAHTILGVHTNFQTGAVKFLVLDPHYTGTEDIAIIQGKGWCGWKDVTFWDTTAYYNLCCPQRPPGI